MRGMRALPGSLPHIAPEGTRLREDMRTLRALLPYLWAYKTRVLLAVACLVLAKLAVVGVPILLKRLVDALATPGAGPAALSIAAAVPIGLIAAYRAFGIDTGNVQTVGPVLIDHEFSVTQYGPAFAVNLHWGEK